MLVHFLEARGAVACIGLVARETEVAAAPVVGPTSVTPTCGLSLRVQCVYIHGEVQLVSDDLLVLARELVGTVDALGVPVCPVKAILKYRDGKWMGQALADDGLTVPSIQVSSFDDVMLGVHPVHTVPGVVDGQPVGPEQVGVGDDAAV